MLPEEIGAMEVSIMKKCKEAKDKGQDGQKRKLGTCERDDRYDECIQKCEMGDRMINRRGNHLPANENSII